MQKLLLTCFLLTLTACAPKPSSELPDQKFVDLFADVIELHRRYPFDPDSLKLERKAVFKRHGITPQQIEHFLQDRENHPDKWDPLIALLHQRFGNEAQSQLKNFRKTPLPQNTKKTGQQ